MKFFTNKSIWSKIIIVLIFIIVFEFIVTKPSLGAGVTENVVEAGGVLLTPVVSLVVTIGDALMTIMQDAIMGSDATIMPIDVNATFWTILLNVITVAVTVLACIAAVIVAVASGGTALVVIASIAQSVFPIIATGVAFGTVVVPVVVGNVATGTINSASTSIFPDSIELPATLYLPVFNYGPEQIFQGNVLLFNVDFFGDPITIEQDEDGNYYYMDGNEKIITSEQDIAADLSEVISNWYVSIRNIALVFMLIILLYTGIRMLLSTLASDRAKYMQMIKDWLVGVVLLFFIHYIMAFSVTIVEKITDTVGTAVSENVFVATFPTDDNNKIAEFFDEEGLAYMLYDADGNKMVENEGEEIGESRWSEAAYVIYPTNSLGKLRIDLQINTGGFNYIGYAICYVVLVLFTCYFTFVYLKRVLYMAFLTIIAPMVAMTYPIDKLNDGKAQGFNRWFREYIFNLLLQPMHLLLYYILITSAFELAGKNIIYSIVAIGFLIPAEKLLRSFFGFEKASTPGVLNGVATGALAMNAINKITHAPERRKPKEIDAEQNADSPKEISNNAIKSPFEGDVDETQVLAGSAERVEEDEDNNNTVVRTTNSGGQIDPNLERQLYRNGAVPLDNNNNNQLGETTNSGSGGIILPNSTQPLRINNNNNNNTQNNTQDEDNKIDKAETKKYSQEAIRNRLQEQRKDEWKEMGKSLKKGDFKRTLKLAGRKAVRTSATAAVKAAPAMKFFAGASKPIARVGGAALAGTAAVAAGVATGDPSKVLQYGATGVATGYAAGKTVSDRTYANQDRFLRTRKDMLKKLAQRDEYNEFAKAELMKIESKEYRKALSKNGFDKEDIDRMQEDGTINRYIDNDIDAENAVAAEKYRGETGESQKKAIALMKYVDRVGDAYKSADTAKWQKQFSGEFQDKGLEKNAADKAAKDTWREIGKIRSIKKGYKN